MIAAILKVLRLKAEKVADELEIETSGVVLGVPVQYGDIQKNVLKQALVKAGFSANKYVLPSIQREFVWSTAQIERLFDSVMQDYCFIFWRYKR